MKNKVLSIIVPCYNEAENIQNFIDETNKHKISGVDFEFIFADDGSKDKTAEILKKTPNIKYIILSRNFGKEAAMYAGLENSSGDYVVFMDADLQDPPSLLPEMYKAVSEEGVDCVATSRITRKGEPKIRSFFAKCFYKFINKLSDVEIVDGARDYRMMTRQMADSIISLSEKTRFSKGLFAWVGFKTKYITYENIEREKGQSKFSFFKLLSYALDGIISFSDKPLYLSVHFGIIFIIVSIIAMIALIIRESIYRISMYGWTSTVCLILGTTGVILVCIGIQGLYISKIFVESKSRPIYISKEDNF